MAGSSGASPTLTEMTRLPGGRLMSASMVRPETWGKRPLGLGRRESPFSIAAVSRGAGDVEGDEPVAERQLGQHVAPGQDRAGRIDLAAADAAAVGDRRLGLRRPAHGVGHERADRGLARAHRGVAAVELDRGDADRGVEMAAEIGLVFRHHVSHLGVRRHNSGVDHAKLRPPGHQALAVLLLDADRDVDGGDVVGVVVRIPPWRCCRHS